MTNRKQDMSEILYFDLSSGVSGDMFAGAMIDLGADFEKIKSDIAALNLDISLTAEKIEKKGVVATKFSVTNSRGMTAEKDYHPEPHRHLSDIKKIINGASLENTVKKDALGIFELLAGAEATAHHSTVEEIHFHEVGAVDAIADIVAAASAFRQFNLPAYASSVNTGSGAVMCAHGELMVPVPAVRELLNGIQFYRDNSQTELTTPTGAAIIKYFCHSFGGQPDMNIRISGCGAGSKDLPFPNVLRVILGNKNNP
jgi:uncharacterized protein (TIGR00299 family) protein